MFCAGRIIVRSQEKGVCTARLELLGVKALEDARAPGLGAGSAGLLQLLKQLAWQLLRNARLLWS